jgi:hypothetical protein
MVGTQRQFLSDIFAVGSGVEGEFEVACLADEKTVGGQDGAVGIGDREAEFAGAILCASERDDKQEQKCGVDQGVDRNTAQMGSPRSAGIARRYFTAIAGEDCGTGALLLSGGRRLAVPR